MFPPLTTGYEERDGSIGPRSLNFYTRLAEGGVGYIVVGDVVSKCIRYYQQSFNLARFSILRACSLGKF